MHTRWARAAAAVALLALGGCTGGDAPDATAPPSPTPETPATSPADDAESPASAASPSPSEETGLGPGAEFGSGTALVDGREVAVQGDCDIARSFGAEPVDGLDDPAVDILLAVDNVTGPQGDPDGPFAFDVVLVEAPDGTRRVRSSGTGSVEVTYEGPATVLELRDRTELDFVDAGTLHVEATLTQSSYPALPNTRDLVLDVTCTITRPA